MSAVFLYKKVYLIPLIVSLVVGLAAPFFLTWFMYILIESGDQRLDDRERIFLADFVRVKKSEQTRRKEKAPDRPELTKAPPLPDVAQDNNNSDMDTLAFSISKIDLNIETSSNNIGFGGGDGEYLPIVKVAPLYPAQARARGIEGECLVEYTVTTNGSVKNVHVIDGECTNALFEKPSIKAALKFKYKPRVIAGDPVEVQGIRNRFFYEMAEERNE